MDITLKTVDPGDEKLRKLTEALDAELALTCPREWIYGVDMDSAAADCMTFLVACADGEYIGCGAIAMRNGYSELKRFYVKPEYRRMGAAKALLSQLIAMAKAQGELLLRLETGPWRAGAIALYESAGFKRIPLYPPYTNAATSLCFEKQLQ